MPNTFIYLGLAMLASLAFHYICVLIILKDNAYLCMENTSCYCDQIKSKRKGLP